MGDFILYQPLTKTDKITVLLYRTGIALTCLLLAALAVFIAISPAMNASQPVFLFNIFILLLYFSTGLCVFFIHLYMRKLKKNLTWLYILALAGLALIFINAKGDALTYAVKAGPHIGPLLLLPLAGCIGFVTAKEAVCFRLTEGYVLALIMPLFLVLLATGVMGKPPILASLIIIAALYLRFALRKIFMPIHSDIGDKSAYR